MQAVFASKMFRSSHRQEAIRAALADPVNQELVLQLKKYLDEDSVKAIQEGNVAGEDSAYPVPGVPADEDQLVVHVGSITKSTASEEDADISDETSGTEKAEESEDDSVESTDSEDGTGSEDSESVDDAKDDESSEDEVTSGFAADMSNVLAAEDPQAVTIDKFAVPALDTVQGQLNSVDDTCGVVRTKQIGDELWIYFNDKKNLNNVMEAVIDRLNAAGYYQLEFNRLARTDNAIVFQIANISSEVNNGETEKASNS